MSIDECPHLDSDFNVPPGAQWLALDDDAEECLAAMPTLEYSIISQLFAPKGTGTRGELRWTTVENKAFRRMAKKKLASWRFCEPRYVKGRLVCWVSCLVPASMEHDRAKEKKEGESELARRRMLEVCLALELSTCGEYVINVIAHKCAGCKDGGLCVHKSAVCQARAPSQPARLPRSDRASRLAGALPSEERVGAHAAQGRAPRHVGALQVDRAEEGPERRPLVPAAARAQRVRARREQRVQTGALSVPRAAAAQAECDPARDEAALLYHREGRGAQTRLGGCRERERRASEQTPAQRRDASRPGGHSVRLASRMGHRPRPEASKSRAVAVAGCACLMPRCRPAQGIARHGIDIYGISYIYTGNIIYILPVSCARLRSNVR